MQSASTARTSRRRGLWLPRLAIALAATWLVIPGTSSASEADEAGSHGPLATVAEGYGHPVGSPAESRQVDLPSNYASLSRSEQEQVPAKYVITSGDGVSAPADEALGSSTEASLASGCKYGAWSRFTSYNNFGQMIYYFQESVDWCYNGSYVTSISPIRVSQYIYGGFALSWDYEGTNGLPSQWNPNGTKWYYRNYAAGVFKYAPPPKLWTLYREYPYVYLDVNGAGGASWWGGRL